VKRLLQLFGGLKNGKERSRDVDGGDGGRGKKTEENQSALKWVRVRSQDELRRCCVDPDLNAISNNKYSAKCSRYSLVQEFLPFEYVSIVDEILV
jgi:hypothetical protein